MAVSAPSTKAGTISNNGNTNYGPALVVLTSLFFMWGFITCLNDILIPHLKAAFDLNYTESMLIQFCFFFAYFVVSLPAGKYIEKLGYQRGIVIGLFMAGIGTLMFYPAAGTRSYVLFLVALFILASGITILQVAANPYVAILGKPKTASARLNLTQAFNSLGTTIAPYLGALLILSVAIKTTEDIKKLEPNQIVKYIEDLKIAKSVSDFKTMDKNEIIRFLITNQKSIDIASSFDSLKNLKGIELNNYISNHSIKIKPESLNRMSDIDIKEKILEPIEKKLEKENKRLSGLNKDELILIVQSKNLIKNPNDFTKISNSELSAYLDAHKSTEYYKTLEMNAVKYPYLGLTAILFFIGGIFAIIKLPKIEASEVKSSEDNEASYDDKHKSAWEYKHLVLGAIAIFVYVGGEVSIGSFLVNYLGQPFIAGLSEAEAGKYVSFYWGGAMVGRFIGSYIQRMIKPGIVLGFNAAIAAILVIITMLTNGQIAMWSILVIGLFNSIMFPTIFTLAIDGLGKHTGQGSGILCMAIVGGAIIPLLQGLLADNIGIHHAFILPVLCYAYIAYYGIKGHIPTFKTAEA